VRCIFDRKGRRHVLAGLGGISSGSAGSVDRFHVACAPGSRFEEQPRDSSIGIGPLAFGGIVRCIRATDFLHNRNAKMAIRRIKVEDGSGRIAEEVMSYHIEILVLQNLGCRSREIGGNR
jgi:hypothetical protein